MLRADPQQEPAQEQPPGGDAAGGGGAAGAEASTSERQLPPVLELGPYEPLAMLGHGTFGFVVLARDSRTEEGQLVAVKLMPRGEFIRQFKTYVMREVLHHGSLHHPFIVGLREVFLTPSHLCIAMEYAAGGDLFQHLLRHCEGHRLGEPDARWIFQQLVVGLQYCHERGVANRDLKLENLLLDRQCGAGGRPVLKICDFGYSKHELNSSAKTGVGTPIYMAPEIIYGGNKYDAKKADLWSCGVILFVLLFGRYPFDPDQRDYVRHIVSAQYLMPEDIPVSEEGRDLLRRLLVVDPNARLGLEQILHHPWFLRDLPDGALHMNEWYMRNAPVLDPVVVLIDQIVILAARAAQPSDPPLSCPFKPLHPSTLPGHGRAQAAVSGSSGSGSGSR